MEDIKEKLERHFNNYFEERTDEAKTQQLEPLFTNKNEAKRAIEYFEENIEAPYVKGSMSSLGGEVTVFLKISLDPKEEWVNDIFENSRYFTMKIDPNTKENNLDSIGKSRKMPRKFRKQKGKTLKEIVNKINKYIEGVK